MSFINLIGKKSLPWILILGGFFALYILPAIVAGGCMVIGVSILIERIWPEQWNES